MSPFVLETITLPQFGRKQSGRDRRGGVPLHVAYLYREIGQGMK